MALEAFLDSDGAGGILEALISQTSMRTEERSSSFLNTAQSNPNFASDFTNFSTSSGARSKSFVNTNHMDSMPFSSKNPGGQTERKKQLKKNTRSCTDLHKMTNVQICRDSLRVAPTAKKTRLDVNQEEEIMKELYLKELQSRNPQLTAMINQCRQQNLNPVLNSAQHLRGSHFQQQLQNQHTRNILEEQGNIQRVAFAPLLDEATSDIFPKLFKIKFESGMLDEILFLDSPRACKIPCGLVLEYGKATQESVYENFRVVHVGTLRVVFRYDLKILSWEFCAQNHEEFLLRRSITPQVNQLVHVAEKFQHDILNGTSCRVSSEQDFQPIWDMFVSAGNQLARNMELPLVNDLGYPKRFIRCLQIAEVVDSMTDLMALSRGTKMGPIDCLNKYSQGNKIRNHAKENQETELFAHSQQTFPLKSGPGNSSSNSINPNHQLLGQTYSSSPASVSPNGPPISSTGHLNGPINFAQYLNSKSSITHAENPNQALVDKLLNEMVNNGLHYGESSNASSRNISAKAEPYSPEQAPEVFQNSGGGFSSHQDLCW
ncbi:hypothetical protein MIMGU_mgv1a004070mg [Erythranthe guttata]|uniref:Uncharacterized protein n=1 Tax=Erythranthe guttata TaxID=4155 RepID=A0A022RG71_ERYGU|nr:hypothetical protein MIMGU_mgv1a004070mg [Erythranthe guttata]